LRYGIARRDSVCCEKGLTGPFFSDRASMSLHCGVWAGEMGKGICLFQALSAIARSEHFLIHSLVNIDRSGANTAGLKQVNRDNHTRIKIRQCKYLNNIIEQDHRRIKRLTRPMLGFKNFDAAQRTLAGIEVMAMIKKGQMHTPARALTSFANQFYSLAT